VYSNDSYKLCGYFFVIIPKIYWTPPKIVAIKLKGSHCGAPLHYIHNIGTDITIEQWNHHTLNMAAHTHHSAQTSEPSIKYTSKSLLSKAWEITNIINFPALYKQLKKL